MPIAVLLHLKGVLLPSHQHHQRSAGFLSFKVLEKNIFFMEFSDSGLKASFSLQDFSSMPTLCRAVDDGGFGKNLN